MSKILPLAFCTVLLGGCSTAPSEEELAVVRGVAEQAAAWHWQLLEQDKTQVFLDACETRLKQVIGEHGMELERRDELLSISVPVDSYFNIKRQADTLLPASLPRISNLVQLLQEDKETGVLILGHLDLQQAKKNPQLSGQQAQAVAALFRLGGLERERLLFKGVGADMPRATNNSAEQRKLNRRVELLLTRQSVLPRILRHYSQQSRVKASTSTKNTE